MKPIIGVTTDYVYETEKLIVSQAYGKAIEQAGGTPVLLYPTETLPDFLDGIVFTGGGDIDPLLFGEEPLVKNGEISPLRDGVEVAFYQQAKVRKLPMLGICRGMQIFAIAEGGSIYQDIYSQTDTTIKHMQQAPRFYGTHTIEIAGGSRLLEILEKKSCIVNSFHHQSVKMPGKGFFISAVSRDGLIEAIEGTEETFSIGVQWHPEVMAEGGKLFQALVQAAKEKGR